MPYLNFFDEKSGQLSLTSKKIKKKGKGRRKYIADPSVLENRFGNESGIKKCNLKLYYEFEDLTRDLNQITDFQRKLKVFYDNEDYPYNLPIKCKELEIVHIDQSKGDSATNNTKDLFIEPLQYLNEFETI